ncbi:hypothetical protein [Psychromonas aquimarina]|uniref:hypothetical protein n=1 Tax=Psychromonas aquimarina TaxID=444919 RepID=UPI00041F2E12|nr:hypothetical protein [Psychromonas aquimarina]
MKKALIGLTCLAALFTTTAANADIKAGFAFDQGFGITAQFDNINTFVGNDGVSIDYIFKQGTFTQDDIPFNWYVGGGAFAGWDDGYGVRLPLGVTLPFAQQWELYGQVSPDLDFDDSFKFGVDAALGVRYAF